MEEKKNTEKDLTAKQLSQTEIAAKVPIVQQIGDKLSGLLDQQAKAFPAGFNKTRFLQNCMTVLADNPGLAKCKPISIVRTLIKGAYLDLDFFRKECYAIPYGDTCNFQTDYKGEVKLVKKYGRNIQDVYAKIVREGDELEILIEGGKQILNFRPLAFNDNAIKGAFAVIVFTDGTTRYETMSIKEIEDVREKYSKAPNSPAWQKSYGEMCKKTVLRRLCKLVDLHFDTLDQAKAYEEGGDVEFKRGKAAKGKQIGDDPLSMPQTDDQTSVDGEIVSSEGKAEPADPDAKLRAEIKAQHPNEEEWKIDARVKEAKGEA